MAKKDETLPLRMDAAMKSAISSAARKRDLSMASMVRQWVREGIAREKPRKKRR